ncbi:MAG: AAA family ATPase [Oscillospiraceae bacterium]|nr:AAA family ATPase [Oscillospiraceae bacterium]
MAKVVLVASGKGGAGKTTVCAFLGQALAAKNRRALLVELDSGLRALDVALGVTEGLVFDLGDVMRGSCATREAIRPCPFRKDLSVICAAAKPAAVPATAISELAAELSGEYDFILLDCPAGIGYELAYAAVASDQALIVATPEPASVRGARAAADAIKNLGLADLRLVIERCPKKPKQLDPLRDLDQVIDGAGVQLLGVIWEDAKTKASAASGAPLPEDSPNKKAFSDLASRLCGERVPLDFK